MRIKDRGQLELLEGALKKLKAPLVNAEKKALIKQNVFQRMAKPREHVEVILKVAGELSLASDRKAMIKENVMAAVESRIQKSFIWSNFLKLSYRALSMVLVVAIGFGALNFFNQKPFVVRAATFTSFSSVSGDVFVKRDGNFLSAYKGLTIMERDEISTSPNSFAVVKYFDDSVTRLSENTRVVINKLDGSEENAVNSYVEVNLKEGMLWSKVINLLESNSVFVVKAADFSAATKRGAFNVEVLGDEIKFGVFNNLVEINDGNEVNQILNGEKLVFDDDLGLVEKVKLLESEKKDQWVQENLEEDVKYLSQVEQKLIETRLASLGVESIDDISFDNSLRQSAALFLTFDDVSESKLKLDLAEKNFIAAQIKLHDVEVSEEERFQAQAAVEDFEVKVKDFYEIVAEVGATDKNYSGELKAYIDAKILAQRKDLNLTLPNSPLYAAKELVQELELLMAEDDVQLLEIKKKQAAEKIAVIEDLVNKGDYKVASDLLNEYRDDISMVIDGAAESELKDKVASEVVTDLKLLDASLKIAGTEAQAAKEEVIEVAQNAGIVPMPVEVPKLPPVFQLGVSVISEDGSNENIIDVEVKVDPVIEGPFGVKIKGDKPLDPLLEE